MKALKDALKAKMGALKVAPDATPEIAADGAGYADNEKRDAEGKREGSDLAPPLSMEHEAQEAGHISRLGALIEGAEGEQSALHDQHAQILAALADQGHPMRGAGGGLRERAAEGAKAKLASMKK